MPLPDGGKDAQWPPARYKNYFDDLSVYDAWYVGDVDELMGLYRTGPVTHAAQYNGGIVGAVARTWYGRPPAANEARVHKHVPLPQDIATLSADILLSEPPRFVLPSSSTSAGRAGDGVESRSKLQQTVEDTINTPEFYATMLEGAELQAALGGVYFRLVWSTEDLTHVQADVVHADAAIPEFRWGDLHAVTFWEELPSDDDDVVWRHLERHEPGRIEHALYEGTSTELGQRKPVEEHPDTDWLAQILNSDSAILTGVKGLTATYIPNMLPNSIYRKQPHLARVGHSDYQSIMGLFDQIDETMSSWMRDIRLAKARLIVPRGFMASRGFGSGAFFDTEREVYEEIASYTNAGGDSVTGITPQQFAIRVEEHEQTIRYLTKQALRTAGYTLGAVGDAEVTNRTATEVKSDDRLAERTRDKKANYWRRLGRFAHTWLDLNSVVYKTPRPDELPEVRFPVQAQIDPENAARTAQLLKTAQAASTETLVRMNHPEWDGETINSEVEKIYREMGLTVETDPADVREASPDAVKRMRDAINK